MEYLDLFGKENYYVEIQRHTLGDMDKCNEWLLRMAKKHALKVIATNDVHYVNQEDAEAHDLPWPFKRKATTATPTAFASLTIKKNLGSNPRFYFKTQQEMAELLKDVPHALDQTVELAERCTFEMNLAGDMILPQYKVPPQYADMDDYLRAMVYDRAPKRYKELTTEITERIDHELKIMKKMGYAGYFPHCSPYHRRASAGCMWGRDVAPLQVRWWPMCLASLTLTRLSMTQPTFRTIS
ncbi:MAG: hypothetical protein R3B47_13760 [Bacteroidia bacterium]